MDKDFLMVFLVILLIPSFIIGYGSITLVPSQEEEIQEFFVGIDVAYDDLDAIKELIDEVSPYTNLFVIGSTGISYNETKLNEACQYLYERDMHFIIYTHSPRTSRLQLIVDIQDKYENHFLGVYFDDEQGGKQLDVSGHGWVYEADNSSDAANRFVDGLTSWLNLSFNRNGSATQIKPSDFYLFSSDYTYYWYDYKAGYDVLFAQLGWNYSRQLNVALCRGAATTRNKDWGAIVVWTYNDWPYIGTGNELFDDMKLVYDNGAKYVLIFDSDENYTQGILREEHFEALKQFWEYTQNNPRTTETNNNRVAYVLPKDYGYGFRGPNDKIWGLWEADEQSLEISYHLGYFLEEYGTNFDIIYDDEIEFDSLYSKYIFWNGTIYSP